MKNKNNEELSQFRLDLRLINYGLEKEIWKDFSNLFHGSSETSITLFYQKYKKGEGQGDLGLNATEDNSAGDTMQQDEPIDQPDQKIDDLFGKTDEDGISKKISAPSETGLSLKQRVNEAFNTLDYLIPVIKGNKNISKIISWEQIRTLKQLQEIFLTPKKKTHKGATQKKQDDESTLFKREK